MRDLKMSDELFGATTGVIFNVCYLISSISVSRLGDVYHRVMVLSILTATSSFLCSLTGLATKAWHLVLFRSFYSLSIAPISPLIISLISDLFDSGKATAIGIYNTAIFLGVGGAFGVGFFLDDNTSSWKSAFIYMGFPGIIFTALIYFTISEPDIKNDNKENTSIIITLKYMMKRITLWLFGIANGLAFGAILSSSVWFPIFYDRIWDLSSRDLAMWMSWISPVSGIR
jgi:MFS family permease